MRTAVVVGAGFVGAACAWRLQRAGFQTTLVDRGDERLAASCGNAGHIAIEQTAPLASLATLRGLPRRLFAFGGPVGLPPRDIATWLPFGVRLVAAAAPRSFARGQQALSALLAAAVPAWRRLVRETRTEALLREHGHFVAWESARSHALGRRAWLEADLGTATAMDASADELELLRRLFAGRPVGAIRFRNTAQIADIPALRGGLDRALREAGGTRRQATAVRLRLDGGRAVLELDDGASLDADCLVVAAGIGAAPLLRTVAGPVPLIAERGYHIESDAETARWPADMPPVAFEDRAIIVTRFATTLRCAGFTEFAAADAPADPRKWDRLERHAQALGLPAGTGRSRWMGARPTLPDYLPAVGRSRAARNLLYAFGHQHLGVTLAAITGELVAALARDEKPQLPLEPFSLERFA